MKLLVTNKNNIINSKFKDKLFHVNRLVPLILLLPLISEEKIMLLMNLQLFQDIAYQMRVI